MLQVVSLTPTSNVKVVAELTAPLTEQQFNNVMLLMASTDNDMLIKETIVLFETIDLHNRAINGGGLYSLNMDSGYPLLTYAEYVEYWSNYFVPLTEAEFDGLTMMLDDMIEGDVMPEDVSHYLDNNLDMREWRYQQVIDDTPISLYKIDSDGAGWYNQTRLRVYEDYIKECENRVSEYKKQFRG